MKLVVVVDPLESSNLPQVPGSRDAAGALHGVKVGGAGVRRNHCLSQTNIDKDMRFSTLSSSSNGLSNCIVVFEL